MLRGAVLIVAAWCAVAVAAPKPRPRPRWKTLPLPPAMPEPTATGTVDVGGPQIYYATYGKGDPVILLHGGLGNADHWAFEVPALADKFQVIVIDSRGQGRSTRTKAQVTYDVMASDVLAVMDHLEIKRAALVGWSDGGEIALKLAIAHPERVARMFVLAANYDASGSKPRGAQHAQTFAGYSAKCKADYQKLSKTPNQFDQLVDWLLPVWRTPMGFTKDQLRQIQAPTVIADGDHDEIIVLEQIREMARLIPNARLEVFTDASHFVLWQDPEDLNKALVEFLSS